VGDIPVPSSRIQNTLKPQWTKTFVIEYQFGLPTKVAIHVFDERKKHGGSGNRINDLSMGSAVFEIGQVLAAKGSIKAKSCKGGGTIFLNVRPYHGAPPTEGAGAATSSGAMLQLQLCGVELKSTEGMGLLRKSDPFYEISRCMDNTNSSGSSWDNVFRSPTVTNNLNPQWEVQRIDLQKLSSVGVEDDHDATKSPLLIQVFDFEKSGNHVLMGQCTTTVAELIDKSSSRGFLTLTKNSSDKVTGKLQVQEAVVVVGGATAITNQLAQASLNEETVPAGRSEAPGPSPVSRCSSTEPTFADYVSGGCKLNCILAIDFTGSNGDPRKPGTLHHYQPGSLNDYEKAITAILSILGNYDSDNKFPTFGFGAKVKPDDDEVQHCFSLNGNSKMPGIVGLDAVLETYRSIFRSGLVMSGPTVFDQVIRKASNTAHYHNNRAMEDVTNPHPVYTVLVIITDGAVTDPEATAKALKDSSAGPMSVVIVGVGGADFSAMEFLDGLDENGKNRNIVQFVEFNKHSKNQDDLTSVTLHEIPAQLVSYMKSKKILPAQTVRKMDEDEVVVEPEESEIDVQIDMTGEDQEIVVSGGNACRHKAW
jgi:copine 1/2/3